MATEEKAQVEEREAVHVNMTSQLLTQHMRINKLETRFMQLDELLHDATILCYGVAFGLLLGILIDIFT